MLDKFLAIFRKKPDTHRADRWIFGTMLFFATAGLIASFTLSVEKLELIKNPDAALSCNISVILNCASVMKTPQAEAFGFPNSYIGLMGYPIVMTIAIAGLARTRFPRGFMMAAQIGYTLGLFFAYWLFFQSVYVIQILCPWCLVVTLATTLIWESLLRYNLRENNFSLPTHTHTKVLKFLQNDYDKIIVASWILVMIALVFLQFPDLI